MPLSMDRWVGKVAIVTGAGSGIGAAIAEALVEVGVKVLGLDLIKDRVDEVSRKLLDKKGKFYPFEADVTKEDNIIRVFEWTKENLGRIHILVNNAGIYTNQTLLEGGTKEWKRLLDTNVMAACIATREAVKNMRENNVDGHIIDINSLAGHKVPNLPTMNLYAASKHAITALVETLRNELISIGSKIKITSISPGTVKTNIASAAGIQMPPEVIENLPMLEPRDIADGAIYVLSTPPHVQVHELTIGPIGEQF